MVEHNPHKISQMGTGTLAAITDASDFPHTGLIKGLSQMARQNIVVKNNGSTHDFNITQSPSSSGNNNATADVIQVAQGSYLRDGKLFTADAVNFAIGTTSNDTTLLLPTHQISSVAMDKGYHLLVVNAANALKIRQPTAANKVPDYTAGDTIIAIIEISSTTVNGTRLIQFLTTDKTENSLSIAHTSSNAYTESGKITGDANSIDIAATITNAHINLVPNGSGRVNIISTDINDAELVISKDVGGGVGRAGVSLISNNTTNNQSGRLTLERTSGSAFIGMDIATDSRDGIRILTGDGSETERMRIKNDGTVNVTSLTASEIVITDASKNIVSAAVGTYPSLAELIHVKGVSSSIQTQITNLGNQFATTLLQGLHSIWIPAEAISPRAANACADLATTAAGAANKPDIRALAFDKDNAEFGQFTIAMPKMWNEGTITAEFYWTCAAGSAGNTCKWSLAGLAVSNDDAIDIAIPSATTVSDVVLAVKDLHVSPPTGAITIGGSPAVGDLCFFQVGRDVSDNLAQDALLMGIKIFYTIDAGNDA